MTCNCELCQLSRRIESVKESGTREELVAMVDELADRSGHAEDDLNLCECILDGSWPFAEEHVLNTLRALALKGQA